MSGERIHYSLRPNKFVERRLFVELLDKAAPGSSPDERVYVSMGGPQLDDQRLVHCRLGIKNLISIEGSCIAYQRQLFNRRPSYIGCWNCTTEEFIQDFGMFTEEYNDMSFIIWLDYTSPRERREQLIEYQTLLGKLVKGDILKITMNANSYQLGKMRRREAKLREQLDEYLPIKLPERITEHNFPSILCSAIRKASLDAVNKDSDIFPLPLAVFLYADGGHPMLTLTVRLTSDEEKEEYCSGLSARGWEYLPSGWEDITKINVPELTAKERLFIEELLFEEEFEEIHKRLPFRLDQDDAVSLEMLKEYARHYCRYPSFFVVPL